jgi:hypothetical protein
MSGAGPALSRHRRFSTIDQQQMAPFIGEFRNLFYMICGEVSLLRFWVVDGWFSLSVSSGVIG